jgi:tryptophan synthase alpha subunit
MDLLHIIVMDFLSEHHYHGLAHCAGVTGIKDSMEARVEGLIAQLQSQTDKPVCVGFGVSKPEQVRAALGFAVK